MSYPELQRGDLGEEVNRLQSLLNRAGAMLEVDGDFGPGTQRGVRYAQEIMEREQTGVADRPLWEWLETLPEPFPALATEGVAFIAKAETGGLDYYNTVSRWPHFPGLSSGITIGVGYDLQYKSEADFQRCWGPHLPEQTITELLNDIKRQGSAQRARELKEMGLEVPFQAAWSVFVEETLPRFYDETERIYPSLARLPDLCRSALVSIVFNRGGSLDDEGRREMRSIRDILVQADEASLSVSARRDLWSEVPVQIEAMVRLWPNTPGLRKRREDEAKLWRKGLEAWLPA